MALSREQIISLIKSPKHGETIKRAKEILKSHQLHLKGVGLDDFLSKIQNYENEEQLENRKKVTKPMTVPIFNKEVNTFDKAFSAQGFSRYYDISGEKESEFKEFLKDVGEGRSMNQWMRDVWLEKVNMDCTGVFMVELPSEEDIAEGETRPYVTFKSVVDMHDFDADGSKMEYIIFVKTVTDKAGHYFEYRVIDEAFDYIVEGRNGKVTIIDDKTIPNPFGYVPAIFASTQEDSVSEAKTSYIWQAIGVADEYLTDSSIHSILKKLHGYPIFWMRERGCKQCSGNGNVYIDSVAVQCKSCNGTGNNLKKDVSDGIVIPQLTDPNQVDSLPVAGYVSPEIATLAEQRVELEWLRKMIHLGVWGTEEIDTQTTASNETATGRMLDIQAIYDKLQEFSENAERVEQFLTDTLGKALYNDSYRGSTILYGRRYFVRSSFELEELYRKAKEAGLPNNILQSYREELVYVKYGNDPIQLDRQLKLMQVEPLQDYDINQVKALGVTQEDINMKVFFNEYITRYEREVKPIALSTVEELKAKLDEYNAEKTEKAKVEKEYNAQLQTQNQSIAA